MDLPSWIKQTNQTQAAVASKLGITQGTLSKLIRGHLSLSLEMALRIEQLTGGQVTVRDLAPESMS